jgi:hypothetical protein
MMETTTEQPYHNILAVRSEQIPSKNEKEMTQRGASVICIGSANSMVHKSG